MDRTRCGDPLDDGQRGEAQGVGLGVRGRAEVSRCLALESRERPWGVGLLTYKGSVAPFGRNQRGIVMAGSVLLTLLNFFGPMAVEAALKNAFGRHWTRQLAEVVSKEEGLSRRERRALAKVLASSWDPIIGWTRGDEQPLRDRLRAVIPDDDRAEVVAAVIVANVSRSLAPADQSAWIDARLADLQSQARNRGGGALSAELGEVRYSQAVARQCRWRRWELRRSAGLDKAQIGSTFQLEDHSTQSLERLEQGQVCFVIAPLGSGKSDWALSWLTKSADRSSVSRTLPLPLLIRADAISGNLDAAVRDQISVQHLTTRGADIVLDGLDEAGELSNSLASQAREFVHRWPLARIVVTSRADEASSSDQVHIEPLSDEEALALINSIRRQELNTWYSVDEQLRDAVHRPLFAIFFALDPRPSTPYELISTMAQGAGAIGPRSAFRDLAIAVMKKGAPVDPREVPSLGDLSKADRDRFLSHGGPRWNFVLPIFLQWFAAQGVIDGTIPEADYTSSLAAFGRWRYVLALALSGADDEVVDRILESVATFNPGAASWLIKETRSSALEVGDPKQGVVAVEMAARSSRVLESLQSRDNDLVDGKFRRDAVTVAVHTSGPIAGDGFDVQWRPRGEHDGATGSVFVPHDSREGGLWSQTLIGWRSIAPLSPWWWTVDRLKGELREALEQPQLLVDERSVIGREFLHAAWVSLTNYGQRPIDEVLARLGSDPDTVLSKKMVVRRSVLNELRRAGDVFHYWGPWAAPDIEHPTTHWVGGNYSHEALRERTQQVIEAAMEAYLDLVEAAFTSYGDALAHRAEMPGTFVGRVYPPAENWANMAHWFLPADRKQIDLRSNHSDIKVVAHEAPFYPDEMLEAVSEAYRKREQSAPDTSFGIRHIRSVGVLDIFGARPATSLAVNWLADDLKQLGRLDGPRGIELG